MFSGVWSPDKKNGLALNEKTMDGIKQNTKVHSHVFVSPVLDNVAFFEGTTML
jgi:hypothetical protein